MSCSPKGSPKLASSSIWAWIGRSSTRAGPGSPTEASGSARDARRRGTISRPIRPWRVRSRSRSARLPAWGPRTRRTPGRLPRSDPMTSARRPARSSPKPDPIAAAVRYLARGDRSAAQVQRHLAGRGFSGIEVRRALRTLQRLGYVNDGTVAFRMAEARLARRPMAREALAAELEARGFSAGAVARPVQRAYAGLSEEPVAERFFKYLPRRFRHPRPRVRRRAGLLRGRGFSADVSESVLGVTADHS